LQVKEEKMEKWDCLFLFKKSKQEAIYDKMASSESGGRFLEC